MIDVMRVLVLLLVAAGMAACGTAALAQTNVVMPQGEGSKAEIARHIARHMKLAEPRLRWAFRSASPNHDVTVVKIAVGPGGYVKSASVAQSSGHSYLDRIAVQVVQSASPLPGIPATGPARVFMLPIDFNSGPFKIKYGRY